MGLAAGLLLGAAAAAWAARPARPGAWETLSGRISGAQGHAWRWAFDVRLEPAAVRVRIPVRLVPASGVTRPEIERVVPAWETAVERIWSRRWAVRAGDGAEFAVVVDVVFRGPRYLHEVIVERGGGRVDPLHWHLADDPRVLAHEVGHLLGLYDEYRGGARPPGPFEPDPESVMSQGGGLGRVRARHLQRILAWFRQRTGLEAELVPLGEGGDVLAERAPPGRYDSSSGQRGEP